MIYADNAATTKLSITAFAVMKPFLLDDYANASQPYSYSRNAKQALKKARAIIANCIGAQPEEIYFTSGGSESDNWAIKSTMLGQPGQMLTSCVEHHAVLHSCQALEKLGISVRYLPVDTAGIVRPGTLQDFLTKDTRLVSVMLVNNEIGTIEPVKELCAIAHKNASLFHTDAVQAVGHIPIDVNDIGIDFLSSSAHKFNGPKGIGFLYIRKGIKISPYMDGGAQEFGLRAGTENVASIVGMAAALEENCRNMRINEQRLKSIEKDFLGALTTAGIDFIHNGAAERVPGNINISIRGVSGEMLLHRLDLKGICISTGSACDSKNTQISHVIKAIKVPSEYAEGTIRVSFGAYNKLEDGELVAKAIVSILKKS